MLVCPVSRFFFQTETQGRFGDPFVPPLVPRNRFSTPCGSRTALWPSPPPFPFISHRGHGVRKRLGGGGGWGRGSFVGDGIRESARPFALSSGLLEKKDFFGGGSKRVHGLTHLWPVRNRAYGHFLWPWQGCKWYGARQEATLPIHEKQAFNGGAIVVRPFAGQDKTPLNKFAPS